MESWLPILRQDGQHWLFSETGGSIMKHNNHTKVPLWNREFLELCLADASQSTVVQMLVSAFPLYLMARGFRASQVGVIVGVYTFCCLIMRALSGSLIDTCGRRVIGLIGAVIFTVPLLGYQFLPFLWLIILCRGIQGFGASAVSLCTGTMAADVLPKERFAEGIGYFGLFKTLATAIGPALGISLMQEGSSSRLFFVTALAVAATFWMLWLLNYEKTGAHAIVEEPDSVPPQPELHGRFLWTFLDATAVPSGLLCFILFFGVAAVINFVAPFAETMNLAYAGLFFTMEAGTMFFSRFLAARIGAKLGYYRTLVSGISLMGLSFLLLGFVHSTALLLSIGALYGLGCGLTWPMFNILCLVRATPHNRGKAVSTYYLAEDAGNGVGALLCGVVIDAFGYRAIFFGSAAIAALVLLLARRWHRTMPAMYGEESAQREG